MIKTRGLIHLNSICIMTRPWDLWWFEQEMFRISGVARGSCNGTRWIDSAPGWVQTNKHSQAMKEWRKVHHLPQITGSSPDHVFLDERDTGIFRREPIRVYRKGLGVGPFPNILILPSILRLWSQLEGRMMDTVLGICSSRSWCIYLKGKDGGHFWTCLVCIIKTAERSKYFGEHLACFEKIAVRERSGLVQLLLPKEVLDEIKGIKENVH